MHSSKLREYPPLDIPTSFTYTSFTYPPHPPSHAHPSVDRMTDRHLYKYYLPPTSLKGGKNYTSTLANFVS